MARIRDMVLLALLLTPAAQASMLYKSIGPNGTVMFSDIPPGPEARIVEQREIRPSTGWSASGPANGFDLAEQLIDSDAVLARANAQLDQAERALAEARRVTFAPREGLKMISTARPTLADEERIENCKRGVKVARQQLMELLRERRRG